MLQKDQCLATSDSYTAFELMSPETLGSKELQLRKSLQSGGPHAQQKRRLSFRQLTKLIWPNTKLSSKHTKKPRITQISRSAQSRKSSKRLQKIKTLQRSRS